MRVRYTGLVVLLATMCANTVFAQFEGGHSGPGNRSGGSNGRPGGGLELARSGRGFGGEHFIGRILGDAELAKKAGLSEKQIETIKRKFDELKQRSIELRAQHELAGMEQAEYLTAEEVDEAALMAAIEKAGKINTEMAKLRVRHLLVIKKNISPEQLANVRNIVGEKRREHFRERRDGGRSRWEGGGERRWRPQPREENGGKPPQPREGDPARQ